jgi:hypothetical protein
MWDLEHIGERVYEKGEEIMKFFMEICPNLKTKVMNVGKKRLRREKNRETQFIPLVNFPNFFE